MLIFLIRLVYYTRLVLDLAVYIQNEVQKMKAADTTTQNIEDRPECGYNYFSNDFKFKEFFLMIIAWA